MIRIQSTAYLATFRTIEIRKTERLLAGLVSFKKLIAKCSYTPGHF